MTNFNSPFSIFEYITIKEINQRGRITVIKFSGHDIYFMVEYWWEGSIRVVSLLSDEIEKIKGN